jgi:hypothetical protein
MNGVTPALTLPLSPRRGDGNRASLENLDAFLPVAALLQFAPDANRTDNPPRLRLTPRAFLPLPGGEGRGEGERSHKLPPPFTIHHSSFCISL